jgi:nitroimidazol reductase NimA-like FMN-containing flavoprotein (pyridoxamine 5'-phosphate oxidase superfamily)
MASILSDQQRAFLEANHSAVMATVDGRGRPHAVPVLCALVDAQLWSSGTDSGPVETRRGRRVEDNLRLYRAAMVAERRLVYGLTPERAYPSQR